MVCSGSFNMDTGGASSSSNSSGAAATVVLKCMIGRNPNPTPEELLHQLRSFMSGSSRSSKIKECIYNGLWLLRHLPVARDAVFDLISVVYLTSAEKHLAKLEEKRDGKVSRNPVPDEELDEDGNPSSNSIILDEIHATLVYYLNSCNEIWSPILSTWSLQLLGQISRGSSNRSIITRAQSVNEVIKIWVGCKAIQSLLDIISKCLKTVNQASTNAFIAALLDTSGSHGTQFDWVVAHVGNSYPQTIVNEVLGLGLQHFSSTSPQISRITSVDRILAYLATTHSKEVEFAFDQTVQSGLSSISQTTENYAIPYLLKLCSSSELSLPLLDVLLDCVIPKLNEDNLRVIGRLFPQWVALHYGGNWKGLIHLIAHLLLKSKRGPKALVALLKGCKMWEGAVGANSRLFLDHFVTELSETYYQSESSQKEIAQNFLCIAELRDHIEMLLTFLTDPDPQIARETKQIIKIVSYYQTYAPGEKAIVYYTRFSTCDSHLWHLANLISALEAMHPNILMESVLTLTVKSGLLDSKQKSGPDNLRQWKNVLKMVKSESLSQFPMKIGFSQVIRENLNRFTPLLDVRKPSFSIEEATVIIEILANISNISRKVRFGTLLTLERYLVDLLFKVLEVNENRQEKIQTVSNLSKLLFELATVPAIQNDALRSLVQSSLNPECKDLFKNIKSSKVTSMNCESSLTDSDEYKPERFTMYVSLLNENFKRRSSSNILRVQSSSFHSGRLAKQNFIDSDSQAKVQIKENSDWNLNVQLFLGVLLNVCMTESYPNGSGGWKNGMDAPMSSRNGHGHGFPDSSSSSRSGPDATVSIEAMRKIALLMVEIVSPDVMFNGLPWPDEEFSKLQAERDLQIRRAFEDHPYLWDLLELVAHHCPSLCYCSVLLRALMAALMAHWASQDIKVTRTPIQLGWTIRLIEIMKTGQLIPPPLCHIGKVLPELKSTEAFLLLRDIWWYMKVNVPVPTAFIRDPVTKTFIRNSDFLKIDPVFTEKLRLVVLNNVEIFGHLYGKLFPMDIDAAIQVLT